MAYQCSVCKQKVEGDLIYFKDHTEKHIVDLVKHDHPEWTEKNGVCKQCYDYYRGEIEGSIFKDAPCAIRLRGIRNFLNPILKLFRTSKS